MQFRSTLGQRVLAAVITLSIPLVITAGKVINQYIVETSDLSRLEEFEEPLGIEVKPLIYYPNPSEETMELYGDQYILKFSTEDQTTINLAVNKLERLHGVKSVTPDVILDVQPISYYDEPYEYEEEPSSQVMAPNPYTPNDPRYPDQWDKPLVETDMAWNTTTGEGAGVAILDQGVDTTHEDLVDNLYKGWDFNEDDADYYDIGGHGTQCCGVACAKIDNNLGIAGVAGDANLMACKIWGDNPLYTSIISNAINYAVDNGVKAISMSWGSDGSDPFLRNIMNDAWDRGAFMCAGVANDNKDQPFYPAAFERVMAVGAIQSDGGRWSSSRYGDWVQIFAPGGLSTKRGGGYGGVQATSFTTPQIAGLAALVWSAHPEYSNYEVWLAILRGADTIDSDVGPILRMNSKGALDADVSVTELIPEPEITSAVTIQHSEIRLSVPASTAYTLRIFDTSGREVYNDQGQTTSGELTFNPDLKDGVYFWRFQTIEGTQTGKLVYVR